MRSRGGSEPSGQRVELLLPLLDLVRRTRNLIAGEGQKPQPRVDLEDVLAVPVALPGATDENVDAGAARRELSVGVELANYLLGPRFEATSLVDAVVEVDPDDAQILGEDEADSIAPILLGGPDRLIGSRAAFGLLD